MLVAGCDLVSPDALETNRSSWPVASAIVEVSNGDLYVNAYLGRSEPVVGRSSDQGRTWEAVSVPFSPPVPKEWAVGADGTMLAVSPVVETADSPDSTGLAVRVARSRPGEGWKMHSEGLPNELGRFQAHGNAMTVHRGVAYLLTGEGIYRSGLEEDTWTQGSMHGSYSLWSVTTEPAMGLYAASTTDEGIPRLRRSTDAGQSWATVADSLAVSEMVYDANRNTLFVSTRPQTIYSVHPGGDRVQQITQVAPDLSEGETGRRNELFALAAGDGTLYAGLGAGAYRSTDGGQTWTECANESLRARPDDPDRAHLGIPDVRDLHVTSEGVILAATWNGVYRSTTGCESWTRVIGPGGAGAS